jgi:hypothetical protein
MPARNSPTCPAAVPLCGTKAEVTVQSLDDWEKEWERAENVESGKLKCATKVAAGGFWIKTYGDFTSKLKCVA